MSLSTLLLDPTTQSLLVAERTARQSVKMARPPFEPITVVSPRDLNISISRDRSPTTVPPTVDSDLPTSTSSSKSSPPDPSRRPSPKLAPSLSRKRQPSRRQSSISYLPADSPRLWTPRTPQTGSDFLDRSPLSCAGKKGTHVRTQSIPFRQPSEPVVLTLPERHTDLLQTIAQKESECLELRSRLAIHESELLDLKRKWERIVHREFGRNLPPLSSTSNPTPAAALSLANTSSAVVLNGLVEGVRALAVATGAPPQAASSRTHSRALSSSSAFAKRITRQVPSNSISSTTTTTATSSSADGSPRLSQSSMSSVSEEKPDLGKAEDPPKGDVPRNEDAMQASAPLSTRRALVAQRPQQQQQRSPTSPEHPPSPSSKTVRRHSRDSRVPLADALKSLTGESPNLGKRTNVDRVSSRSVSISGMNPLGAMSLGRANLGEAAQGWVDSVGSKLAELQKGQTFSKSQKRASVLLSDVSQSLFSALTPGPTANLIPTSAPPTQSLIDEDDDAGCTALGRALLPDVVSVSGRGAPSETLAPSTPGSKEEEEEENWNWNW